jgi:hypothetical protein
MKANEPRITEVNADKEKRNPVFTDDKLSWQNIILTQEKWARTDDSWGSVLALIILTVIIMAILLMINALF